MARDARRRVRSRRAARTDASAAGVGRPGRTARPRARRRPSAGKAVSSARTASSAGRRRNGQRRAAPVEEGAQAELARLEVHDRLGEEAPFPARVKPTSARPAAQQPKRTASSAQPARQRAARGLRLRDEPPHLRVRLRAPARGTGPARSSARSARRRAACACAKRTAAVEDELARERRRARERVGQFSSPTFVDEPQRRGLGLGRVDRAAAEDEAEGRDQAVEAAPLLEQPRQPLRAAVPGQQVQVDLLGCPKLAVASATAVAGAPPSGTRCRRRARRR